LGGVKGWWAALISDPPTDIDFSPVECSFNAYLDEIDAVL
jgi:hypothetical protein